MAQPRQVKIVNTTWQAQHRHNCAAVQVRFCVECFEWLWALPAENRHQFFLGQMHLTHQDRTIFPLNQGQRDHVIVYHDISRQKE